MIIEKRAVLKTNPERVDQGKSANRDKISFKQHLDNPNSLIYCLAGLILSNHRDPFQVGPHCLMREYLTMLKAPNLVCMQAIAQVYPGLLERL